MDRRSRLSFEQLEPRMLLAIGEISDFWNGAVVPIPDNGGSSGNYGRVSLDVSGAPSGAIITDVDIYYEVKHPYRGDLKVWATTWDDRLGWQDWVMWNRVNSGDNIAEWEYGIDKWDGLAANRIWWLVAGDYVPGNTGYLDFFEVHVHWYRDDEGPYAPGNVDMTPTPSNDTGQSQTDNITSNTSPQFQWTKPADRGSPASGTKDYYYYEVIDSGGHTDRSGYTSSTSVNPGSLSSDNYRFWVCAQDNNDNWGTWGYCDFTIDASNPGTPTGLTNPADPTSDMTPNVTWGAPSGTGSSIWKYEIAWDDSDLDIITDVTCWSTDTRLDDGEFPSALAYDRWEWYVRAYDVAGNVGSWAPGYLNGKPITIQDWGDPPDSVTPGSGTWVWSNPFGDFSGNYSIAGGAEWDAYAFMPDIGGSYVISTGGSLDSQLRIYNSSGAAITGVIDSTTGGESTTQSFSSGNWYYVVAAGYRVNTGNYTLGINGPDLILARLRLKPTDALQ